MRSFVVDTSVVVKWLLPDKNDEGYIPQALSVLRSMKQGVIKVFQPPHWLAEAAGVIVRLRPKIAKDSVDLLCAMELNVVDVPEIYSIACGLSEKFNHHVFDTLYHAVAIFKEDTQLITADERYYRKAFKQGNILSLDDFF